MTVIHYNSLLIFTIYVFSVQCFTLNTFTSLKLKTSLSVSSQTFHKNAGIVQNIGNRISHLEAATSSSVEKGHSNDLICDITRELTNEELSNENLVKIVLLTASDKACNELCWKCLGYIYNSEDKTWNNDNVFPKWKIKYPEPVDLIGVTRIYDPKIDLPVRKASIDLMRSIPRSFKGGIRNLQGINDFQGFSFKNLTPNITRRAQLCNFIMYYRDKLHGKTLQELIEEKCQEPELSEEEKNLPSEKAYQKLRLDVDIEPQPE